MITVWVLILMIEGQRELSVTTIDNIATYAQCSQLAHRIDADTKRRIEAMCFSVQKVKP